MGEVLVPADALYGAQTQRAVENFPISRLRFTRPFIRAIGLIKAVATRVNGELGVLPRDLATAIEAAANRSLRVITMRSSWSMYFRRGAARQRT